MYVSEFEFIGILTESDKEFFLTSDCQVYTFEKRIFADIVNERISTFLNSRISLYFNANSVFHIIINNTSKKTPYTSDIGKILTNKSGFYINNKFEFDLLECLRKCNCNNSINTNTVLNMLQFQNTEYTCNSCSAFICQECFLKNSGLFVSCSSCFNYN